MRGRWWNFILPVLLTVIFSSADTAFSVPSISSISVPNGTTSSTTISNITVTASSGFTIYKYDVGTSSSPPGSYTSLTKGPVTLGTTQTSATFDATGLTLTEGTSYYVYIAVSDGTYGSPGASSTAVAADFTAPTVSSVTATSTSGSNINKTTNFTVKFNERMDTSTLTTTNIRVVGNLTGTYNTSLTVGATQVTIAPNSSFEDGEAVTVAITTGAKDVAGNALASTSSTTFNVVDTAPAPSDIYCYTMGLSTIQCTFLQYLNSQTFIPANITLTGSSGLLDLTFRPSNTDARATKTLTITTASDMISGDSVTLTMTTGVKDTRGNALTGTYSTTFTAANVPSLGFAAMAALTILLGVMMIFRQRAGKIRKARARD